MGVGRADCGVVRIDAGSSGEDSIGTGVALNVGVVLTTTEVEEEGEGEEEEEGGDDG